MKTKNFVLVTVFLLSGALGFSVSPEDLVGPERTAALRIQGSLTEVQLRNPSPLLLPRHNEIQRIFNEARSALGPSLLVESLFLYKKPAGAGSPGWTAPERVGLFNGALALETLTGIQYYSTSRKTMRTFYESSTVIDGPDTKRPLPDPVYAVPPAALTVHAQQKDLTFGNNIYRYEYYAREDTLVFVQQNLTALSAGIITAVGKNNLRSMIAIIDAGDCLVIYAASMAKAASFPGMDQRIGSSFTTRAEAVVGWFTGQADKVFGNEKFQ